MDQSTHEVRNANWKAIISECQNRTDGTTVKQSCTDHGISCNYRMSNVIAGVVRGQLPYLKEYIAQKKVIFERYQEGFKPFCLCATNIVAKNIWNS